MAILRKSRPKVGAGTIACESRAVRTLLRRVKQAAHGLAHVNPVDGLGQERDDGKNGHVGQALVAWNGHGVGGDDFS